MELLDRFNNALEAAKRNVFVNEPHTLVHERAFEEGAFWAWNFLVDHIIEEDPEVRSSIKETK